MDDLRKSAENDLAEIGKQERSARNKTGLIVLAGLLLLGYVYRFDQGHFVEVLIGLAVIGFWEVLGGILEIKGQQRRQEVLLREIQTRQRQQYSG